jgi:MFS family permease
VSEAKPDPYAVLRYPSYRYFVFSRSLYALATQMQTVAVSWEIYQRLHTNARGAAIALGMIGLAQVLPMMVFALPAGQTADRLDRRNIARAAQVLFAVCAMAILLLSHYRAPVWCFYFALSVASIGRAFSVPAINSLFSTLVPRELLPAAMTWNSTVFQTTAMIGPAAGGLIVAQAGPATSYIVNIVFAALSFLSLSLTVPAVPQAQKSPMTWTGLADGVRFVFSTRLLLGLFCLDLFAVLLGGATALLPIYANDILKAGPTGFGLLRSAPSAGAVVMALVIAHLPPFRWAGRTMLAAVAGFGFATIVFGVSHIFWLSMIALALVGMCDNVSVVVRQTVMQMLTPDRMRGRVSSVSFFFISCSNELGELESGLVAGWLGAVKSVVFGGIGTLLVVLGAGFIFPEITRLGRLQEIKAADVAEDTDEELEGRASS